MRTLLIIVVMIGLVTQGWAQDNKLTLQTDKLAHMGVSYGLTLTGYSILTKNDKMSHWTAYLISSLIVASIGVFKEFAIDKEPSLGDIQANTVGSLGAGAVVLTFDL